MCRWTTAGLTAMLSVVRIAGAADLPTPPQVWAGYEFRPAPGSDLTKVIFAELKWVPGGAK